MIDFCVFRSVQVYTKKLVTAATFFLRVYLYGILLYFGRFAFKRGDGVPKFHYETRAFSRVIRNRLTKKCKLGIMIDLETRKGSKKKKNYTHSRPFPDKVVIKECPGGVGT